MSVYSDVMNIRHQVPDECKSYMSDTAYVAGHRDARHAAADIVVQYQSKVNAVVDCAEALLSLLTCDGLGELQATKNLRTAINGLKGDE